MIRDRTAKQVAAELGCAAKTVRRWCKDDGCPHDKVKDCYKLSVTEVKEWLEAAGVSTDTGPRSQTNRKPNTDTNEPIDNKEKKLYWDARKAKMQALIAEGKVIDAAEVKARSLRQIAAVKQGLMTLPAKVSGPLAHKSARELESGLTDAVRELLDEFAEGAWV